MPSQRPQNTTLQNCFGERFWLTITQKTLAREPDPSLYAYHPIFANEPVTPEY